MSIPTKIVDPFLSVYLFFLNDEAGSELAERWHQGLAERLGVPAYTLESFEWDPTQPICLLYEQLDAQVLYLSLDLSGEQPLEAWQTLSTRLFGEEWQLWEAFEAEIWPTGELSLPSKRYWGASFFFGGQVEDFDFDSSRPDEWLETSALLPEDLSTFHATSVQAWGNVWLLGDAPQLGPEQPHIYLILAEAARYEHVKQLFFTEDNVDLLALSLHKCYHGWRQYEEQGRTQLHGQIAALDGELKSLLRNRELGRNALNALSQQYLQFVDWVSQISELENMITINANNFHTIATALRLLRGTDEVFEGHWQRLQHYIGQMKADQIYYDQALKRLSIGIETLRAELELRLLETELEAAATWRQLRDEQERERDKRAKEKEEAAKQKEEEEEREKERELLFVRIGLLLGITQLWPILQQAILEAWPEDVRFYADVSFIIFISFATGFLLWQLVRKAGAREE